MSSHEPTAQRGDRAVGGRRERRAPRAGRAMATANPGGDGGAQGRPAPGRAATREAAAARPEAGAAPSRPASGVEPRGRQGYLARREARLRLRRRLLMGAAALVVLLAAGLFAVNRVQSGSPSFAGMHPYISASPPTRPAGAPINGIQCNGNEQLFEHIHQHLDVVINGKIDDPPAYIGFGPGGKCLYWIHVHHDYPGVIHLESPINVTYTLGDYLDIWAATPEQLTAQVRVDHRVLRTIESRRPDRVIVDGKPYGGDVRAIPLRVHTQITLEYGRPYLPQQPFDFTKIDGSSMPQGTN